MRSSDELRPKPSSPLFNLPKEIWDKILDKYCQESDFAKFPLISTFFKQRYDRAIDEHLEKCRQKEQSPFDGGFIDRRFHGSRPQVRAPLAERILNSSQESLSPLVFHDFTSTDVEFSSDLKNLTDKYNKLSFGVDRKGRVCIWNESDMEAHERFSLMDEKPDYGMRRHIHTLLQENSVELNKTFCGLLQNASDLPKACEDAIIASPCLNAESMTVAAQYSRRPETLVKIIERCAFRNDQELFNGICEQSAQNECADSHVFSAILALEMKPSNHALAHMAFREDIIEKDPTFLEMIACRIQKQQPQSAIAWKKVAQRGKHLNAFTLRLFPKDLPEPIFDALAKNLPQSSELYDLLLHENKPTVSRLRVIAGRCGPATCNLIFKKLGPLQADMEIPDLLSEIAGRADTSMDVVRQAIQHSSADLFTLNTATIKKWALRDF